MTLSTNPTTSSSAAAPAVPALPPEVWGQDLEKAGPGQTSWLWHGYLAHANVTLLTSQWKSGKTTLLSLLLAAREAGGDIAGLAVTPGRTVVVSEEPPLRWTERRRHLGFGPSAAFLCRPFRGRPTLAQWLALIDRLAELHETHAVDLAVIDPLSAFLPGRDEAHAGLVLEALVPLQRLTTLGLALFLLHHPRKGLALDGQAARGSGVLTSFADIVLEMRHYRRAAEEDRRRVLWGYSRLDQTPRQRVIELTPEGTSYLILGTLDDVEFDRTWELLRQLLAAAKTRMTRTEILAAWPGGMDVPNDVTLWRWLERAVSRGLLRRDGEGHRTSPFRYWLPGQEQKWKGDPQVLLQELARQDGDFLADLAERRTAGSKLGNG